jgi:hypothetical protein
MIPFWSLVLYTSQALAESTDLPSEAPPAQVPRAATRCIIPGVGECHDYNSIRSCAGRAPTGRLISASFCMTRDIQPIARNAI